MNPTRRMHHRVGAALLAGGALVATMALGACGGGSSSNGEAAKSAQQIVTDAENATRSARSVHISGYVSSAGQTTKLDVIDGQKSGGGTIGVDNQTFQVVLAGSEVYMKANAAAWTAVAKNASAGQLLADRWVKTPISNSDFSDFADLLVIPKLVDALQSSGPLTKQKTTTVDGQKVVPIKDNGSNQGTLDVAASGQPYIVSVQTGGQNSGVVHFSQYGKAALPTAPANALDLSSLEGS